MTVVAAWVDKRGAWMAADGNTFNGSEILAHNARKIVKRPANGIRGTVLIAHCGDCRLGRAADDAEIPLSAELGTLAWARRMFDALDAAARDIGASRSDDGIWEGAWLVAAGGRLWGGSTREPTKLGCFGTLGAGADFARGALHVLADDVQSGRISPVDAVVRAVGATIASCRDTGGTVTVVTTEAGI